MIIPPRQIAGIYNHVVQKSSLAEIGGIYLRADSGDHMEYYYTLSRFKEHDAQEPPLWTMRFGLDRGHGRDNSPDLEYVQLIFRSQGLRVSMQNMLTTTRGLIQMGNTTGDVEQLHRDWVILMLYDHEWRC
jgi:hypothetical protein